METLLLFLLAGAVTLFFMRGKIKGIGATGQLAGTEFPQAIAVKICSSCTRNVPENRGSCPHCGKSVAMSTA